MHHCVFICCGLVSFMGGARNSFVKELMFFWREATVRRHGCAAKFIYACAQTDTHLDVPNLHVQCSTKRTCGHCSSGGKRCERHGKPACRWTLARPTRLTQRAGRRRCVKCGTGGWLGDVHAKSAISSLCMVKGESYTQYVPNNMFLLYVQAYGFG